jgi:UDP-N-acetylglucosamine 2-epimerase (non-hydrolysing)
MGTNVLVGQDGARLRSELGKILQGGQKQGTVPPLWDGHAGQRIAEILSKL